MSTTGIPEVSKNLTELIASLEPKRLRKALRGTLTTEANRIAKVANRYMAAQGFNNAAKVGKAPSFRGIVWKKKLEGFSVKTRANGHRWMYRNQKGNLLPIPYWMEMGTGEFGPKKSVRKTKPGFYYRGKYYDMADKNKEIDRSQAPQRGSTKPVNALDQAKAAIPETERKITETFRKKVEQQIKKHGR